jgi:hypothetical protein
MNGHATAEHSTFKISGHFLLAWNLIGAISTLTMIYLLLMGQGPKTPCSGHILKQEAVAKVPEQQEEPVALHDSTQHLMSRSMGWYTHPADGELGRLGKMVRLLSVSHDSCFSVIVESYGGMSKISMGYSSCLHCRSGCLVLNITVMHQRCTHMQVGDQYFLFACRVEVTSSPLTTTNICMEKSLSLQQGGPK